MNVPAGQGPNGRLPAASAAAWAPRPGLRPGPRACVVRACVRAGARRPRASARACPSPLPRGRVERGAARGGRWPLFRDRGGPAGGARGARRGPDAAGRRGWGLGFPLDRRGARAARGGCARGWGGPRGRVLVKGRPSRVRRCGGRGPSRSGVGTRETVSSPPPGSRERWRGSLSME